MQKKIFARTLKYILPYKRHFLLGSLLAFAFSLANGITLYSLVPIFDTLYPGEEKYQIKLDKDENQILKRDSLKSITDKAIFHKARLKIRINNIIKKTNKLNLLIYICSGLFFVILIRTILKLLSVYYIGYAGYGAIRDIRHSLYQSILRLPITFFQSQKTGGLISKIIYNTDLISGSLSNQLRKFIVNIFIVITHITLLLYINSELTLLALLALIAVTIPILYMGRAFRQYSRIEQRKMSDISSIVLETINGISIIKSYGLEDLQIGRFLKYVKAHFYKKIQKAMIDIGRPQIIEIISSLFLVFLFIYGGGKTLRGEYTKGEFLFFVLTFLFIMNPIKQIANMNNQIKQAEAAGENIFDIIDQKKEIQQLYDRTQENEDLSENINAFEKSNIIIPQKDIRFEHVYFKYPTSSTYVLSDITFSIEAGKTCAIVGRSGAGKTTLLDLLPKFLNITDGSISIDGVNIRSMPLQRIRNSIGIVTQEIFLFNGTIAENIAYGRADFPFEKIVEAAQIANAHDFIMKMPEEYQTIVGERGMMLSGGERQRIAIARSILRDPPILILDEATSSLDTESERLVQSALNRLMGSRSSFVIAHRLSTIERSDLIIVLDKSRIAEMGTHIDLLHKNGIYKKLYDIQISKTPQERE